MKKIFTLLAAVAVAACAMAGSYGILVNDNTYFAGTKVDEFEGFQQYLAHVKVTAGDQLQLCDAENRAVWAVDLNASSVAGFTRDGNHYNATVSGCYDFYIKLKYEADELYIGSGSDCGEGINIDAGVGDDVNYYAIGWINGADHGEAAYDTYEDDLLFVDGKLTINCQMGSYIAVKDHMGNFYYAEGNSDATGNTVTLKWANGWSPCQKWAILEGTQYIIIRSAQFKGQIVLETVDKATYDAYSFGGSQAIENAEVSEKARKIFIDGQLRIVRSDKIYDATGRQL